MRRAAAGSLKRVESRLARADFAGLAFSGVSLASILLLAALGLAITYGLMGVINMAHGELIMIGAYATYVVQSIFRSRWPAAFDWYLPVAVPFAFAVSAAVGMALERTVIRRLYGRPLETLLATWGISLVLIQAVRTIFGAQNVQVENPAFMSGGVEIFPGVVLPWSRIVIIGFAAAVLAAVGLLLARTRLGLFVRGVTQNRAMAACVGVPHRSRRHVGLRFGLRASRGSRAARSRRSATSAPTWASPTSSIRSWWWCWAAWGSSREPCTRRSASASPNKLLESWSGAVLAKIAVLAFIIVFIQKRPQGLFALKGRAVEA